MPDLTFAIMSAAAVPYAASPLLAFKLRIANAAGDRVQSVLLRCQVQIEAARRQYAAGDEPLLHELFGERSRWSQTLKSMLWTFASVVVPGFDGETEVDLPVPCTYDFNVAAAKYFHALQDGEVPLTLLFSGTVFYQPAPGAAAGPFGAGLQVAQIPWEKEAAFRLPVKVWHDMMAHYYPNSATLSLRRDVFDRLYRFKMQHALPTWEQALELLLEPERVRP